MAMQAPCNTNAMKFSRIMLVMQSNCVVCSAAVVLGSNECYKIQLDLCNVFYIIACCMTSAATNSVCDCGWCGRNICVFGIVFVSFVIENFCTFAMGIRLLCTRLHCTFHAIAIHRQEFMQSKYIVLNGRDAHNASHCIQSEIEFGLSWKRARDRRRCMKTMLLSVLYIEQ